NADDANELTLDVGTAAEPGGNSLFGTPGLKVELTDVDSTSLIPAFGNTWGEATPSCSTIDDSAEIWVLASTSIAGTAVQTDATHTCP
ncbi:MAG: hypothetical protein IT382_24315, partial [Deltaproteobacteria bacterium]|nr:hypothetical protein [Deltaproteobacteria bacterium]